MRKQNKRSHIFAGTSYPNVFFCRLGGMADAGGFLNMNKLYGPYECSDGRKRVVHNGKTKLYARYLIEQKLDRELSVNEDVDHKDSQQKRILESL